MERLSGHGSVTGARVSESQAEINAARLVTLRHLAEIDRMSRAGEPLARVRRVRYRRDNGLAPDRAKLVSIFPEARSPVIVGCHVEATERNWL